MTIQLFLDLNPVYKIHELHNYIHGHFENNLKQTHWNKVIKNTAYYHLQYSSMTSHRSMYFSTKCYRLKSYKFRNTLSIQTGGLPYLSCDMASCN